MIWGNYMCYNCLPIQFGLDKALNQSTNKEKKF